MRFAARILVAIGCVMWLMQGVSVPIATAAIVAPSISIAADSWHVNATLAGVDRFVFVVKVSGQPDVYFANQTSPFLLDPWVYGGKAVSVSARAEGPITNPWASPELRFTVAPPKPMVSVATDGWHVNAYLPGTSLFKFVVKVSGKPDVYIGNQTSPFAIDRDRFGGREVSVSARAEGSATNPWASPELRFVVPAVKAFGIDDATGGLPGSGADAKAMGITLDRINFVYGATIAEMDAKVAREASFGLTPLVILAQYSTPISQLDTAGWQSWASTVVARYGPGGAFWQGRPDSAYASTYFEVLNEPYGFWFYSPPEPAAYATFFANVVTAAKAANPRARFLLASYPHTFQSASGGPYTAQSWDTMLKSSPDGARAQQLADGVTTHPYGSQVAPRGWRNAEATHNNFPQLPVWITEIGYRIGETIDGITVTEQVQASLMDKTLDDFAAWPWAQGYLWFKWADYGAANMWGVVRPDGTHRPAYDVYRSAAS